ncbi:MAG: CehA/McbA family metallohydrolase [Gemmataceae bacterium]|nr:CehA/McbA family metallohydrolase [Gemmataceae bacterium]
MSEKLQSVHVRINDAATGKPTPVRVRFTDEAGTYFAPLGRLSQFSEARGFDADGNTRIEGEAWAFVDGSFEILLTPGRFRVQVAKGPEYRPLDEWMTVQAGRLSMRLTIERIIDMHAIGFLSVDIAAFNRSPHSAYLEMACEDLSVANLLVAETKIGDVSYLPNICAFTGQDLLLAVERHGIFVNTHNQSDLGNLHLLNSHRVVYPLSFRISTDSWILEDWCDQCHRKKGLVVADDWAERLTGAEPDELLAEIVRGKIDVLHAPTWDELPHWYELLNAGLRIPIAAGSRKDANRGALGSPRTYVAVNEKHLGSWIEPMREGRSFVTNGAILVASFSEFESGDAIPAARTSELRFACIPTSNVPIGEIEVVVNGQVTFRQSEGKSIPPTGGLGDSGWIAARCRSSDGRHWAHTNPVYFEGDNGRERAEARARLSAKIERTLTWAREPGNVADDRAREHLIQVHLEAKNLLRN